MLITDTIKRPGGHKLLAEAATLAVRPATGEPAGHQPASQLEAIPGRVELFRPAKLDDFGGETSWVNLRQLQRLLRAGDLPRPIILGDRRDQHRRVRPSFQLRRWLANVRWQASCFRISVV